MTKKAIANKEKGLHSDFLKTIIKIQIRGWLKSVITLILNLLFKWVQKLKHLFQLLLSSDRSFGEKFFSHSLQTPGAMQRFELLSGILLIASANFGLINAQLPNNEVLINSVIRSIFKFTKHCEFLEYWNTRKSVWRIWLHFLCLLDEGIPKIWKKLNSYHGFLSYWQNSTANSA